jgi:flavin-binding protein dodecin
VANSIVKVIEISAQSTKGLEDAIQGGLKRAGKTVKNIQGAWIGDIKVVTKADGSVIEWRVHMRVSFIVD